MKYKVEMQQVITFAVEADSEEQFIDWAAEVTPMEARGMIDENGRSVQTEDYYDTILEVLPDDTEADINIREEGKMTKTEIEKALMSMFWTQKDIEEYGDGYVADTDELLVFKGIDNIRPFDECLCTIDNGVIVDLQDGTQIRLIIQVC